MKRLVVAVAGMGLMVLAPPGAARADTAPAVVAAQTAAPNPDDVGMIHDAHMFRPKGPAEGVVVLISDARGWSPDDQAQATHLQGLDYAVIGLDLPHYLAGLEAHDDDCAYAIADIEELSKRLQASGTQVYQLPVIAGRGDGGGLAVALAAQTPASTIGAVVAVDPSAGIALKAPLCTSAPSQVVGDRTVYGLMPDELNVPVNVTFTTAATPDATRHIADLHDAFPGATSPGVISVTTGLAPADALQTALDQRLDQLEQGAGPLDLPIAEMPVDHPAMDTMAIIYSGDGGWRDLDLEVGQNLQKSGVPVIGVDSLRYFWTQRSPEQTAQDLSRIIRHYRKAWGVKHVLLAGYSFGADVLPESYDLLPAEDQDSIAQLSLMALSHDRDYVIHVSGWLGLSSDSGHDPARDLGAVPPALVQCIYGTDDPEDACHDQTGHGYQLIAIAGSHHFDEDYPALTQRILTGLEARLPARTASNAAEVSR